MKRHLSLLMAAAALGLALNAVPARHAVRAQEYGGDRHWDHRGDGGPRNCSRGGGGGAAPPSVPFGLFGPNHTAIPIDQRLRIYNALGMRWTRITTSIPVVEVTRMTDANDIPAFRAAGYDIFLNLISPNLLKTGQIPDLNTYGAQMRQTLARYPTTMLAVENEVDNYPAAMSSHDYLAELKVGCAVAHQAGVQCTDSGLTSKMTIDLLIDWDLEHGDVAAAQRNARYLGLWYGDKPPPGAPGDQLQAYIHSKGVDRGREILQGIRAAGADRVDLHWYIRPGPTTDEADQDGAVLSEIFTMLTGYSGLPVTAGEVGVDALHMTDLDVRADQIHGLASSMARLGAYPVIIWNPGAGLFTGNLHAFSLVDNQGRFLPDANGLVQAAREAGAHPGCQ